MSGTEAPADDVSVIKMNLELQHAQLELLSAHCATHKLRLHFSTEQLARHGRRDVLRKSIETASALNEFFASVEKQIPVDGTVSAPVSGLTGEQFLRAFECVSSYLDDQRKRYLGLAAPLSKQQQDRMSPYFSAVLLDQVRIVELHGTRITNPQFYEEARAMGFINLPDFAHMNSVTFLDVLVFNETITERSLFHALVHAVQFQVLGLKRYTELFVRSFVASKFHFLVPLEAHAFFLESKFARPTVEIFSVEDQVRLWARQKPLLSAAVPSRGCPVQAPLVCVAYSKASIADLFGR